VDGADDYRDRAKDNEAPLSFESRNGTPRSDTLHPFYTHAPQLKAFATSFPSFGRLFVNVSASAPFANFTNALPSDARLENTKDADRRVSTLNITGDVEIVNFCAAYAVDAARYDIAEVLAFVVAFE
jgi:hypothetical protein